MNDIEQSQIEAKYKPILKLTHKVNEDIRSINEEDVAAILEYGFWWKSYIRNYLHFVLLHNLWIPQFVAHQIKPLDQVQNVASAKMMIEKGYDGLAEFMLRRRNK